MPCGKTKKKKGGEKSCFSFHLVTVKCDHQIVSRLMREIEDFLCLRWVRDKLKVRCAKALLGIQNKWCMRGMLLYCVSVFSGGLQKYTELLLTQTECGGETLRGRGQTNYPHVTVAVIRPDTCWNGRQVSVLRLLYSKCWMFEVVRSAEAGRWREMLTSGPLTSSCSDKTPTFKDKTHHLQPLCWNTAACIKYCTALSSTNTLFWCGTQSSSIWETERPVRGFGAVRD